MYWVVKIHIMLSKYHDLGRDGNCLTDQSSNQIIIYTSLHPLLGVDEMSRVSWQLVITIHSEVDCLILCECHL